MAKIYSWRFNVRAYDLGENTQVSPAVFQNYLEETAIQASASNGFDMAWYANHNCSWIIRRMQVRYEGSAKYGDEIQANSWVSDFRRVRSNREYELVRVKDVKCLVRGRADWIFVDTASKRPQRLFPEFDAGFAPDPTTKLDLGVRLVDAQPIPQPRQWTGMRVVSSYEMDEMHHVNNGNYLRWIEDAHYRACQAWQFPIEAFALQSHDLEYVSEAKFGDEVRLNVELLEYADQQIAWQTTISHAQSGAIFTKNYAVYEVRTNNLINRILRNEV